MARIAPDHPVATREEWLKQRMELLEAEKALTRQSDALARRRQALPWVRIEKDYRFDTCSGEKSLAELFHGRSQLLVYHLMFGPDYAAPCPSCSMIADGFNGFWEHLAHHDVMLVAVSRAPFGKIEAHKHQAGWTFPWVSSFGSDFNNDFNIFATEAQQRSGDYEYNFRPGTPIGEWSSGPKMFAEMSGTDVLTYVREKPGMSAFALGEDGEVYHTYSTYARGLHILWGAYQWLDRAPLGRNETGGLWWKRRYEYGPL